MIDFKARNMWNILNYRFKTVLNVFRKSVKSPFEKLTEMDK